MILYDTANLLACLACAEEFQDEDVDWLQYRKTLRTMDATDIAATAAEVLAGDNSNPLTELLTYIIHDAPPDLDRVPLAPHELEAVGKYLTGLALDVLRKRVKAATATATF